MLGTKWQSVTGRLRQVSVGQAGVWGVSPRNEVSTEQRINCLFVRKIKSVSR